MITLPVKFSTEVTIALQNKEYSQFILDRSCTFLTFSLRRLVRKKVLTQFSQLCRRQMQSVEKYWKFQPTARFLGSTYCSVNRLIVFYICTNFPASMACGIILHRKR